MAGGWDGAFTDFSSDSEYEDRFEDVRGPNEGGLAPVINLSRLVDPSMWRRPGVVEKVRLGCAEGKFEEVKELLNSEGYTLHIDQMFKGSQENPLITACLHGHLEIIKFLLTEKGANPNANDPEYGLTPLIALASCDKLEDTEQMVNCAKALVEAGADLNFQDMTGRTGLMVAVHRGRVNLARYLLDAGTNPDLEDPVGETALVWAIKIGDGAMCKLLVEYGADLEVVAKNGWKPYEYAKICKFTRLSNCLRCIALEQAKDPHWCPRDHIELLDELGMCNGKDDELPAKSGSVDEIALEDMLRACGGEKYVNEFRQKGITFKELMLMNENQLKILGIREVGIRNRLADAIKKAQLAEWHRSSLPRLPENLPVTAGTANCAYLIVDEQLDMMSNSMEYLAINVPQAEPDANTLQRLQNACRDTRRKCDKVRCVNQRTLSILEQVRSHPDLQVAGIIPERRVSAEPERRAESRMARIIRYANYCFWGGVAAAALFNFRGHFRAKK